MGFILGGMPGPLALRSVAALLALLAGTTLGCNKSGTAPGITTVRPTDRERGNLLLAITIGPPQRILDKVEALARKLELPFSGKEVASTIAAQNDLAPEIVAQVDLTRATGIAIVAPLVLGGKPLQAVSAAARDPKAAETLVAALGTVEERRAGARRLRRADGSMIWVATDGVVVVAGASHEGLFAAGPFALEAARRATEDAMVATMYPDALARWQGTDVAAALARFQAETIDPQLAPGERAAADAVLGVLLQRMAQTASAELALAVDPADGVRATARLVPRAGSPFAQRIRTPAPYAIDPALLSAPGTLGALWSSGASTTWIEICDGLFADQPKAGPTGARDLGQHWKTLRPHLTGAFSADLRVDGAGMSYGAALGLGSAAVAGGALEALAAIGASRGFADLLRSIYGRQAPAVRSGREGSAVRTELAFPAQQSTPLGRMLQAMFGGPTVVVLASTAKARLLLASGSQDKTRLAALATAGAASAAGPELLEADRQTRGADGFAYVDLWATLRPAMAAMRMDPQQARMIGMATMLPGFARLKLPIVMSYRGGEALTAELHVPFATLQSAAGVVRPFIGMGVLPGNR